MARSIIRTKGLCERRARLSGTRTEVCEIIRMVQAGAELEAICAAFSGLTWGQLQDAKDYYKVRQAEIDQDMTGVAPTDEEMAAYDAAFEPEKKVKIKRTRLPVKLKDKVLVVVTESGENGMTDKEIQKRLRKKATSEVPRRFELAKAGLIVDSGKKRQRSIVWVASGQKK